MNLTVRDSACIAGQRRAVYDRFWDPMLWPRVNPHVRRVEMIESGERQQRFRMTVESNGREYVTESERVGVPGRSIRYRQLLRPAFLLKHEGRWTFASAANGTKVTLTHRVVVDPTKALELLGATSVRAACAGIRATLHRNGAATIDGLKQFIERNTPSADQEAKR